MCEEVAALFAFIYIHSKKSRLWLHFWFAVIAGVAVVAVGVAIIVVLIWTYLWDHDDAGLMRKYDVVRGGEIGRRY